MQGGIIDKDMPIPSPTSRCICPSDGKPTRVGYRFDADGTKIRVCKKYGGRALMSDDRDRNRTPAVPRLKERVRRRDPRRQLKERARPRQHHAGPAAREDRRQHGRRRAPSQQPSLLEGAVSDLTVITGQKPLVTRAKKSIAGFKLREGNAIGAKVTLRGDRMWEFLDRLISLAIPRIRDFRGPDPRAFDGHGNYTFGVTEQLIFPEIDYDQIDATRGMDITIVTTATHRRRGQGPARRLRLPVPAGRVSS